MNGTLAKVRAIMRDELDALSVGEVPVSHVYRRVVDLIPDNITEVTFQSFSSGKGTPEELSSKELALVRTIRGLAKANTTQAPCVSGNP